MPDIVFVLKGDIMKEFRCVILLLAFFGVIGLVGCSNSDVPIQSIPESTTTTISEAIETKESFAEETTIESEKNEETSIENIEESTSLEETVIETKNVSEETDEIVTESEENVITETEEETILPVETTTAAPIILQGYLFQTNGISIGMHEDAESVLAALGTADSYFETPSCAFLGIDRQYTYGSYVLTTYEENKREYVYDIYFLDENISTPEGIRIGSGIDEVIAAYGDGYTEDFGMYTYIKERSKLQFLVVDGIVTFVDYTALTD